MSIASQFPASRSPRGTGLTQSLVIGSVVLLTAACREEIASPTGQAPVTASVSAAAAPLVFRQVSAGADHTCGVTVDDVAYCWGEGGELGIGSPSGALLPTAVAGGLKFRAVNAGANYACGIATDGLAYCWGANTAGELGDGTTQQRNAPVPVAGGRKWRQLRAGYQHTCGVTTGGLAFCWGWNGDGALGDGTLEIRLRPVRVAGGLAFEQVRAGGNHTCGWTTSGKAYCWGANNEGQLGDGTTARRLSPVPVAGGLSFAQVSPGAAHTCGATPGDIAYCWGRNSSAELGDGSVTRRLKPRLVAADGRKFDALATGVFHTCALTPAGRGYCWGANDEGQLGTGAPQGTLTPKAVRGGLVFAQVSVGVVGNHGCGVTGSGAAYCWGKNNSGQIGNGTMVDAPTPTAVLGPS
jgi:hypothetical protein